MGGGVEAELSAGLLLFVDGADYVTAKNLGMRLFVGVTNVGTRLIRLGCLPGCPKAAAEAAVGGPNARTPEQRAADKQAYKSLVAIPRYAELWGLNKTNLIAIVEQALHLAQFKQYVTVASVAITAASAWMMHIASDTNCGVKTTTAMYAKSFQLFCEFAAAPHSQQPGGVVVPIKRYVAVTFMRAEQARRKWMGNRPSAVNADASGSESDADGDGHGSGVGKADGDDDEDMLDCGERGCGGGDSPSSGDGGRGRLGGHSAATDTEVRGAPAAGGGARWLPVVSADGVSMDGAGVSRGARASEPAPTPARRVRTAGQTVAKMHRRATAKVVQVLNQLWTACGCAAFARYDVEAFESVGTYSAAHLLVGETQRNRTLENKASGVAKATGLRDPDLPDKDRRALIEKPLLGPTTSK